MRVAVALLLAVASSAALAKLVENRPGYRRYRFDTHEMTAGTQYLLSSDVDFSTLVVSFVNNASLDAFTQSQVGVYDGSWFVPPPKTFPFYDGVTVPQGFACRTASGTFFGNMTYNDVTGAFFLMAFAADGGVFEAEFETSGPYQVDLLSSIIASGPSATEDYGLLYDIIFNYVGTGPVPGSPTPQPIKNAAVAASLAAPASLPRNGEAMLAAESLGVREWQWEMPAAGAADVPAEKLDTMIIMLSNENFTPIVLTLDKASTPAAGAYVVPPPASVATVGSGQFVYSWVARADSAGAFSAYVVFSSQSAYGQYVNMSFVCENAQCTSKATFEPATASLSLFMNAIGNYAVTLNYVFVPPVPPSPYSGYDYNFNYPLPTYKTHTGTSQ